MRIGRESTPRFQFAPEILQLLDADAALKKRARIHPWSGMALKINRVPFEILAAGTEEMVEPHFVQSCRRRIGRNMPTDVVLHAVGADNHRQGVPADERLDPTLKLLVSGEERFKSCRNGIRIWGIGSKGQVNPANSSMRSQSLQNLSRDVRAARFEHRVERFEPLLNLHVLNMSGCESFLIHT